jgi:signal transduction histidine kinase
VNLNLKHNLKLNLKPNPRLIIIFTSYIFLSAIISYFFYVSFASVEISLILFFVFVSIGCILCFYHTRKYFVSPFDLATMFVERLSKSQFEIELPELKEPEANRLMQSLNKLMLQMKLKDETILKLETLRIDLVANVSHELKTPLTSIKGYIETLKNTGTADLATREKFLDRIEVNANRLEALISDLLALSKLEKSGLEINWEVFESDYFIEKLESTFLPTLTQKKQSLNFNFKDRRIEGDRLKLEQVFNNLIENACRYTPEGSRIEINETKDESFWYFEVIDNGPGISQNHLPRLFERFYRVNPDRNRETGGTGLGLAIVKHAVSVHGGSITVESKIGEGTKFLFRFPRHSL